MASRDHSRGSSDVVIRTPAGSLSGLIDRPPEIKAAFCLAHGAGAGMRHPFLARIASLLTVRGIATLRFQFPYMELGKRRTDPPAAATAAVIEAVQYCAGQFPAVPLLAGGKSFGGRMTTLAAAERGLALAGGIVLLGFPLHPPKTPGTSRAEHLGRVAQPMLFFQGTRDSLATIELMREVVQGLPNATLEVIEGADHSFAVPKSVAPSNDVILERIADRIRDWIDTVVVPGSARSREEE